ncbi:zinc ribbon domain-containing protein [Mycolicibacterium sp. GF69]|nr:zinc ribbon domain-containing protein [Mycolicibacterium sp. GF69]
MTSQARVTFGLALGLVALLLAGFAVLRWQAPMIAVAIVGVPLVFVGYLRAAGVHRDVPTRQLALAAALAAALGIGWASMTRATVARSHDVALNGHGLDVHRMLVAVGIPVGSAVLMLVALVVLRFVRPMSRAPLDGYAVGALSAVVFIAGATLVRLIPQFATGVTAPDRPVGVLLVQAGIQGVALPLTAAALGGLVGGALWAGRLRQTVAAVAVTLILYAVMGATEYAPVAHGTHLAVHAVIAVIALAALRIGQHTAPTASARTDRDAQAGPARVLATLAAGLAVAVVAGWVTSVLTTPDVPKIVCPPDCGRPPIGEPIESNPRFYADNGVFSVQYPGPGSAYEATFDTDGVELDFTGGDTGTLELFGLPAGGRTPKQITEDLIDEYYPDAATEYEIPNAMVGYEPGYGVVADDYPQDANGSFTRLRLIVMVAVKNDYALVASAIGPYRQFTRDFGTGHPSGANLQLAMDMGKYVNSFRWEDVSG